MTTEAWIPPSCVQSPLSFRFQAVAASDDKDFPENRRSTSGVVEGNTNAFDTSEKDFSSWMEVERTLELLGITWNDFLSPVIQGVLPPDNENPLDWDSFWELSLKPREVAATKVNDYNTRSNDTTILVAEQFAHYLERLGPTYVKFGQALSSRPDLLPRSLAIALTRLQDDIEVVGEGSERLRTRSSNTTAKGWGRLDKAEGAREVLRDEYFNGENGAANSTDFPFRDTDEMEAFLQSLSETPVAAASIGVVYSGILPSTGEKVAIKIQRPRVQEMVKKDARLLRRVAEMIEAIPSLRTFGGMDSSSAMATEVDRFMRTDLTGAVDEFMTRLEEELNYRREADNLELFGRLYSHQRPKHASTSLQEEGNVFDTDHIRVVVPAVYRELCTERVLVMEWIEGIKLVDLQQEQRKWESDSPEGEDREALEKSKLETLELIQQGIDCTLSQLLETGILHADPHGGNLLKVAASDSDDTSPSESFRLGYIDFGLLSTIPTTVQDGLICAVCQLIFAKNVTAVGELFGELQLLPEEVLMDPVESQALSDELTIALSKVLVFPVDGLPTLRFDKLLDVLTRLVPRFRFQLPPYFLNNARALATLEGMAREMDPNFNILRHLYPYAISRVFSNPTTSNVVEKTLKSLIENPTTGKLDIGKLRALLRDVSMYSGYSKTRVISDIARSKSGPKLVARLMREQSLSRVGGLVGHVTKIPKRRSSSRIPGGFKRKRRRSRRRDLFNKLADYLRL